MNAGTEVKAINPLSANQITEIAELSATETPSEIARKVGCDRSTVYRRLARGSTKKLIEIIQRDYIHEALPKSADNMLEVINGSKLTNQQFRASERALESAGVLNSQSQSIYIQQIVAGNQITISPVVQGLLDKHLGQLQGVEDAEIVNPDNSDGISRISVNDVHSTSAHTNSYNSYGNSRDSKDEVKPGE